MARTHVRRTVGTLLTLVLAGFAVLGFAGAAQAEEGYRYWNYSHVTDGAWEFSADGLAQYKPEDGAVEGIRYGTSTVAQGIAPRVDPADVSFEAVCSGTEAAPGQKRVAIVIDYGSESEADGQAVPAHRAECAVGGAKASTQQLLGTIADLRVESGFVCAVDGYPVKGCGDPVKNADVPTDEQPVAFDVPADETATDETATDAEPAAAETTDEGSSLLWPLVGAGALVAAIAGGGLVLSRRNTSA